MKNLLAAGGHRGRIQKNDCNGWKFVGKYSVNKNDNERDEISEENTFDFNDNIIIHINNLQEHQSDSFCCKLCVKNLAPVNCVLSDIDWKKKLRSMHDNSNRTK